MVIDFIRQCGASAQYTKNKILTANALADDYPAHFLHSSEVADARCISREAKSADAILCMGPLYPISEAEERDVALRECDCSLEKEGKTIKRAKRLGTPYVSLKREKAS